jgi:hypothetical protein
VAAARSILRFCRQPGAIAALVEGPVTMHQSLPLRQLAVRGLAERAEVRLDLRHCAYLDSTFRGILHFFCRSLARTEHAMQWRAMLVPRQPASISPPHGDIENGLFRPVDELSGVVAGPATSSDFLPFSWWRIRRAVSQPSLAGRSRAGPSHFRRNHNVYTETQPFRKSQVFTVWVSRT